MMFFYMVLEEAVQKRQVLRVLNIIYIFFYLYIPYSFRTFFHGSGSSGLDPDFLAGPDPKHWHYRYGRKESVNYFNVKALQN